MAYVPQSGSVVAFQGNPSVLQVLATVTNPVTFSSISGTVGASVIGLVPVQTSNSSVITVWQSSSVIGIVTGSVVAIPTGNQSVSGSISVTTTDIAPATQNITVVDTTSSTVVGANGQNIVIGTPTVGSAASFTLSGVSTIRVEVTGIWTGTIVSEQSIDGGTTWVGQGLHQGAYTIGSWTAGFVGGGNVAGATNYRIRATAAITGTAVVKVIQSVNEQSMYIANAAPAGTVISLLNSTTATLGIGATFTGTGEDVSNFSEMRISVFADQASGTDGFSIQQSTNNTNWDITDTYTIPASTGKTFVVPRQARYFRMVYTNGGTSQGAFRLQSILNRTATAPSSNRASDGYTNETDLVQNQVFSMVYNGSTWDRARGNTTQGTQVFGSVTTAPSGNQSVSGAISISNFPTSQNVSGSVVSFQGGSWAHTNIGSVITVSQGSVATVIIGGSIAASFTPPANQSVSGAVSISNFPTSQNVSGSVVAFQGTSPWSTTTAGSVATVIIGGSIAASFTPPANQSVSGAVSISNFPTTQNVSGSVVATQGTNPWTVVSSISGGIFPISGSVAATITNTNLNVSGSVVSFQGGAWAHTNIGSVITTSQGSVAVAIISGSIAATFTPPANQSVSGSVGASVIGLPPVNVLSWGGAGTPPSGNGNTTAATPRFVLATDSTGPGSVVAFQGTTPFVVNFQNSSILSVPVGSTVALLQSPSVVGTYAEDAGHTTGDKGLFVLGVRNDTLSSVSSNDADYTQYTVGPMGEMITANSPITKWVYGTNSIVSGASVALIAAQGASIFTYVTGLNIVNPSANNLTGNLSTGAGAASILIYFTAPANGGSNMVFPNPLRSRDNTAILASISGVGSVLLSAQGFIAKT